MIKELHFWNQFSYHWTPVNSYNLKLNEEKISSVKCIATRCVSVFIGHFHVRMVEFTFWFYITKIYYVMKSLLFLKNLNWGEIQVDLSFDSIHFSHTDESKIFAVFKKNEVLTKFSMILGWWKLLDFIWMVCNRNNDIISLKKISVHLEWEPW